MFVGRVRHDLRKRFEQCASSTVTLLAGPFRFKFGCVVAVGLVESIRRWVQVIIGGIGGRWLGGYCHLYEAC